MIETGTGVPQPFTSDVANKFAPVWSPKGDRIVFSWDPKGVLELYEKRITCDDGTLPQWRGDGLELFYVAPDNRLMSVSISVTGSTIETGTPVPLFTLPPQFDYAASRDGQRFLVNKIVKDAAPITILLNWKPK